MRLTVEQRPEVRDLGRVLQAQSATNQGPWVAASLLWGSSKVGSSEGGAGSEAASAAGGRS